MKHIILLVMATALTFGAFADGSSTKQQIVINAQRAIAHNRVRDIATNLHAPKKT